MSRRRMIYALVMTVSLVLTVVTPATGTGTVTKGPATFHHALGDEISDQFQLDQIRSVAFTSSGVAAVLMSNAGDDIHLVAPDGQLLDKFGGGNLAQPLEIHIGPTGRYYVRDGGFLDDVVIYRPDGTRLRRWDGSKTVGGAEFKAVVGLTVDSNDRMIAGDSQLDLIQVINPDGSLAALFGGTGTGPGEFNYPNRITTDSANNIYVLEGSRLQAFDPDGNYLFETVLLDGSGSAVSGTMDFDHADRLHLADSLSKRIHVYDNLGTHIMSWKAPSAGPYAFLSPGSIDFDNEGMAHVIDYGWDMIFTFDIHECKGRLATLVGTNGADEILGTAKADVIVARGGDDLIVGYGGKDRICAGKGDDTISGEGSADRIWGGRGDDFIGGGSGKDVLRGGSGSDDLLGGDGFDICRGGPGSDTASTCETVSGIP